MQLVNRKSAKSAGLTHYFTGIPCKHGHIAQRFVSNTHCTECHKIRESNPSERERRKGYGPTWHAKNKEKISERKAAWYVENKADIRKRQAEYHKANPDRGRLQASIRRARVRNAFPPWADRSAIHAIYRNCPAGWHVDHIVPLYGLTPDGFRISGLHCEANLRYLPASENLSRQHRMTREDLEIVESIHEALMR